jgi:hypothetical protein
MASVTNPNPVANYPEGRPNRVLSIAPVQAVMVRYVDPDGKESVVLCYVFGEADYKELKDPSNPKKPRRMAGVWTVANLQQLQATMKLASGHAALSIIQAMEEKGLLREGKVVGGTPATVELPDVSSVFEDLDKKDPETEEQSG